MKLSESTTFKDASLDFFGHLVSLRYIPKVSISNREEHETEHGNYPSRQGFLYAFCSSFFSLLLQWLHNLNLLSCSPVSQKSAIDLSRLIAKVSIRLLFF